MITIVLIIHVFIVIALVGVVLLQRSEGGALGIGGGGGAGGGFMTGRGAANALTRATTVLAGLFFITSLGLAVFGEKPISVDDVTRELTGQEATIPGSTDDGSVTSDDLLGSFGTTDDVEEEGEDLLSIPDTPATDEGEAAGSEADPEAQDPNDPQ